MKFDFTHGEEAKYLVSMSNFRIIDHAYFSDKKAARECFNRAVANDEWERVSLTNMKTDKRLMFYAR